jgi:hypothetical protein
MTRWRPGTRWPAPVLAVLLLSVPLAGCSSGSSGSKAPTSSTPPGAVLPGGEDESSTSKTTAPRTTAVRTTPSATVPTGKVREVTKACPYISNQNEAIAEGKAVGRSTVLTTKPVGCKFYLAYPDYHVVTEITVKTYPTEVAAFNTVAHTGGSTAESTPGIGDGAVLYRTSFYKPDGNQDWACIFAKGKIVVTIHTDELHSSIDARNVAAAVVGKF